MAAEADTPVAHEYSSEYGRQFEQLQKNKIYTVSDKARTHLEKIATEFSTWEAQNMSCQGM
jgi:hypothetical protein